MIFSLIITKCKLLLIVYGYLHTQYKVWVPNLPTDTICQQFHRFEMCLSAVGIQWELSINYVIANTKVGWHVGSVERTLTYRHFFLTWNRTGLYIEIIIFKRIREKYVEVFYKFIWVMLFCKALHWCFCGGSRIVITLIKLLYIKYNHCLTAVFIVCCACKYILIYWSDVYIAGFKLYIYINAQYSVNFSFGLFLMEYPTKVKWHSNIILYNAQYTFLGEFETA